MTILQSHMHEALRNELRICAKAHIGRNNKCMVRLLLCSDHDYCDVCECSKAKHCHTERRFRITSLAKNSLHHKHYYYCNQQAMSVCICCLPPMLMKSDGSPCSMTALNSISSAKCATNILAASTRGANARPGLLRTALPSQCSKASAMRCTQNEKQLEIDMLTSLRHLQQTHLSGSRTSA